MDLKEIKQEIAQNTKIPIDLLTGDSAEETIARAKALICYQRDTHKPLPCRKERKRKS